MADSHTDAYAKPDHETALQALTALGQTQGVFEDPVLSKLFIIASGALNELHELKSRVSELESALSK